MASDKELIAYLLDALENAYVDRTMLMTMVMTYCKHFPQIGDWEKQFEELRQKKHQGVRELLIPLRRAIATSRDVEAALEAFLKDTDPKGPVH
ncbi:MAG: hypothetical protein LAO09_09205 [Acidobacteriia bacterium]|nr:hypothetical protein [Terriglobia bacterium]